MLDIFCKIININSCSGCEINMLVRYLKPSIIIRFKVGITFTTNLEGLNKNLLDIGSEPNTCRVDNEGRIIRLNSVKNTVSCLIQRIIINVDNIVKCTAGD